MFHHIPLDHIDEMCLDDSVHVFYTMESSIVPLDETATVALRTKYKEHNFVLCPEVAHTYIFAAQGAVIP